MATHRVSDDDEEEGEVFSEEEEDDVREDEPVSEHEELEEMADAEEIDEKDEVAKAAPAVSSVKFVDIRPSLCDESLRQLAAQSFSHATPVQAAAMPLLLAEKDVAVQAVTGSGKTLAFLLPLIEVIRKEKAGTVGKWQVLAMVIAPTRELAAQIGAVAAPFLTAALPATMRHQLLTGGRSVAADVAAVTKEGVNIIVGTPGRIDTILTRCQSQLQLSHFKVLVLDEADRLLDLGFTARLAAIMQRLPRHRLTALFSATQTKAVDELAAAGLRNAVRVDVKAVAVAVAVDGSQERGRNGKATTRVDDSGGGSGSVGAVQNSQPSSLATPPGLSLEAVICLSARDKTNQMVHWLASHGGRAKVILFVTTCACVDFWSLILPRLPSLAQIPFIPLHGQLKQKQREASVSLFRSSASGVLVATDVAARGLDIEGVDHILQFDPPQDPKTFLHRAGRTARMGATGAALLWLLPKEGAYVEYLQRQGIPVTEEDPIADVTDAVPMLRKAAREDRAVMEMGTRAFVSFVRAYKEHHCNFIFRLQELEMGGTAMGYGLLTLPAMPERKKLGRLFKGFYPDISTHEMSTIAYRDQAKEIRRQQTTPEDRKHATRGALLRNTKKATPGHHDETKLGGKKSKRQRHDEDVGDILSEYREMKKEMKSKKEMKQLP